jgi:hypothetical protein
LEVDMTERRVTLAEIADPEVRRSGAESAALAERELVKEIADEFMLRIVGERMPIADAGWDTTYCLHPDGCYSRAFRITVRAALNRTMKAADVRSQIGTALRTTPTREGL